MKVFQNAYELDLTKYGICACEQRKRSQEAIKRSSHERARFALWGRSALFRTFILSSQFQKQPSPLFAIHGIMRPHRIFHAFIHSVAPLNEYHLIGSTAALSALLSAMYVSSRSTPFMRISFRSKQG